MIEVRISLVGTSPLLMHNVTLADQDCEPAKAWAQISAKRKKTEKDRADIARIEWFAGLYLAPGVEGPVLPTKNILRSLVDGGKVTRQGVVVTRALTPLDMFSPLAYEGPRDPQALWDSGRFIDRSVVNVGKSKVVRTRPRFDSWAVVADFFLQEDLLGVESLDQIAYTAGRGSGLGDNRINGFGRYRAKVEVI